MPSKHFLFSKTSSRRLQDVFSVTIFCFTRRLQDFFKTYFQYAFKTFSRRLQAAFQDVLKTCFQDAFFKMFSRRLQKDVLQLCLEDVFKTSSSRVQYVFTKTNVCWVHIEYKFCVIYRDSFQESTF